MSYPSTSLIAAYLALSLSSARLSMQKNSVVTLSAPASFAARMSVG